MAAVNKPIQSVGVMAPGDMGQAVAQQLKLKGFEVSTALARRSERTKALAREADITDLGSLENLAAHCEVILSIMNPAAALDFATDLARILRTSQRQIIFVDCNAIAPVSMHAIADVITAAGGYCIDGGIIGQPPRGRDSMSLYLSGPQAHRLEQFATASMRVRVLGERVGDASAIKMCYAAMTKGTMAVALELLIAARRLGVEAALEAEFKETQSEIYNKIINVLPRMMPKTYRWPPEMLEIAQTFKSLDMTPHIFEGIANLYEFIAATKPGKETPENRDASRSGQDVIRLIADEAGAREQPQTKKVGNTIKR